MIDKYQATKKRNIRVSRAAKERRAKLLAMVSEVFTCKELIEASGLSRDVISAQIQKMVLRKEITQNSTYSKPRIYTKVAV